MHRERLKYPEVDSIHGFIGSVQQLLASAGQRQDFRSLVLVGVPSLNKLARLEACKDGPDGGTVISDDSANSRLVRTRVSHECGQNVVLWRRECELADFLAEDGRCDLVRLAQQEPGSIRQVMQVTCPPG